MDTVRDMPDRNLFHATPWPQTFPHVSTDNTVQIRNTVGNPTQLESKDRHAE